MIHSRTNLFVRTCRYTFGTSPYPRLLDTSKDHLGQLMSHHVPFCFAEEHFKIKIRDTRSSKSKSVRKEKRDLTPAIIQRWSDSKTIFLLPSLGATFKPNLVAMHSPLLEHRHAFTSYYSWGHFSLAISKSHAKAIVAFWWQGGIYICFFNSLSGAFHVLCLISLVWPFLNFSFGLYLIYLQEPLSMSTTGAWVILCLNTALSLTPPNLPYRPEPSAISPCWTPPSPSFHLVLEIFIERHDQSIIIPFLVRSPWVP